MSPTTGIAASQLRQLIYYHLDNDMLDNANFLAGRLHALEPRNPDSSHLLSLTYLRSQRYKAAYDFSFKYGANGRHLGCAYIFAQSCLQLGRNTDGIHALEKARGSWSLKNDWDKHSETSRRHVPDAPAALTLLAKLYRAHGDMQKAGDSYIEAHKQNPFVWDAFEGLCKIGVDLKVENMFKPSEEMPGAPTQISGEPQIYIDEDMRRPLAPQPNRSGALHTLDDPFTSTNAEFEDQEILPMLKGKSALKSGLKSSASGWDTPIASADIPDDDVTMENDDDGFQDPPAAPSRRPRGGYQFETSDRPRAPMLRGNLEAPDDPFGAPRKPSAGAQKRTISGAALSGTDSAQPRRSNRLYTQSTTNSRSTRSTADASASTSSRADRNARTAKAATGTKGRTGAVVGRVVSGNRKIMPPDEKEKEKDKRSASRTRDRTITTTGVPVTSSAIAVAQRHLQAPSQQDMQSEQQAMRELLGNFKQLAVGYFKASKFELPEAISLFQRLPAAQRETPWVFAQLGKAQYEAGEYRAAEESFGRLMKMQPSRVEDMETYSTVLWHLKKETALSYLCRVLRDEHFDAPQTWVALGNAFSLTREHDQAISAFKRATQLDEKFAYAWTLMGHEYMANEAFDSALAAFRKAVAIDRRGYGGWYGLGKCFERMGKMEDAERHYRIAAKINPSNATLLVCIGVVLERLQNKTAALSNYARALELAPGSALARFKKARVLMHMREYSSALLELQILQNQAPDEANVHFLLGKCHKGLGEKSDALRSFTQALNLDVKAAPFIKEAMDTLGDDDDEVSDDD
ncbi:related to 20S cyclosome subunit (Nuc2 Cdc27) [Lecanosticta acicola]|uniref:Related to 20S cyclosome subunit ( Nuc2 Cdc27) n=1 Tax=Lecanosticta acicola TaxID=111012 RepID=A0AAI9ECH7_9PEZI|nr:related to 20S cyclosome subunit (Nuc2 Cdc27) [Lecanosticta acicola]